MKQIHVRVSDDNSAYIDQLMEGSGLPLAQVIGMLLDKSRDLGWRITPGDAPRVTYHMS